MPRVSAAEVRQVIKLPESSVSNATLAEQIAVASRLTSDLLSTKGLSDDRLKDIEKYLSAHFAALYDREAMSTERKIGEAETEYYVTNAIGKYLDLTVWGQMAKLLDTSSTLVGLIGEEEGGGVKKSALFRTFGTKGVGVSR